MARKPYYCGRCGSKFHSASKYCPKCGAILSLPLGSRGGAAPAGSSTSLRHSGWLEVILIMSLLFVVLYFGIRAIRARDRQVMYNVVNEVRYVDIIDNMAYATDTHSQVLTADQLDDYEPPTVIYGLNPEHQRLYGHMPLDEVRRKVESGEIVPRTSAVPDDSQGDSDGMSVDVDVNVLSGSPDSDDPYFGPEYHLRATGGENEFLAVEPGMSRQQVLNTWGRPLDKNKSLPRDGKRYERWYYGDPIYNMDVGTRYVEFGPDGRVSMVRDGDRVLRDSDQVEIR